MQERSRNMIVGLTTLAGIAGLIGLIVVFGYLPQFLRSGYAVTVNLPRAGGLHSGSRVKYSGLDIGSVESVALRKPPHAGVRAVVLIRRDVRLPAHVQATVSSQLLGGGSSLQFYLPHARAAGRPTGYLSTKGKAVVQGQATNLVSNFTDAIKGALKKPMKNLDQLSTQFHELSGQWRKVGHNLNNLIEPRPLDAVAAGKARANLATVLIRTDRRLAQLKEVLAGVNGYVNDKKLRRDVRQTAANARQLSGTVANSVGALRKRYLALADHLNQTMDSANKLVKQARAGKGTMGKLVNDPALYNNLNDAVQRMQKAIRDMRLLVQKWKAEGLPIHF